MISGEQSRAGGLEEFGGVGRWGGILAWAEPTASAGTGYGTASGSDKWPAAGSAKKSGADNTFALLATCRQQVVGPRGRRISLLFIFSRPLAPSRRFHYDWNSAPTPSTGRRRPAV